MNELTRIICLIIISISTLLLITENDVIIEQLSSSLIILTCLKLISSSEVNLKN